MSSQYNEYSKPAVAGSSCSYGSLGYYYGPRSTARDIRHGTVSGVMVVPTYDAIGYDALTHGVTQSCGGYFNIIDAYGPEAANCNPSYSIRRCGGYKR